MSSQTMQTPDTSERIKLLPADELERKLLHSLGSPNHNAEINHFIARLLWLFTGPESFQYWSAREFTDTLFVLYGEYDMYPGSHINHYMSHQWLMQIMLDGPEYKSFRAQMQQAYGSRVFDSWR